MRALTNRTAPVTHSPRRVGTSAGGRPTPCGRSRQRRIAAVAALVIAATVSAAPADAQGSARGPSAPGTSTRGSSSTPGNDGAPRAADAATLLRLECEMNRAAVARDMATFRRLTAPDYTSVAPDGTTGDRAKDIASMETGKLTFTAASMSGMRVRQYENVAVLTGQNWVAGTLDGQAMSGTFQWTDTWIRRGGQWQLVATQVTAVAAPPTPTPPDQCAAETSGIPAGTYTHTVARADLPDSLPPTEAGVLAGTWTMTFDAAGHSTVRRNGEQVVEGNVKTSPDGRLDLDGRETGPYACDTPATYRYAVRGDSLTYTKVTDTCTGRALSLTVLPWTRVP